MISKKVYILIGIAGAAVRLCNGDFCPENMPKGWKGSRNDKLKHIKFSQLSDVQNIQFDNIIVGGGGTGCPFARELADQGKKVLIIERGSDRSAHILTHDIYGAGLVINDPKVSQPVITTTGVRTHVANVLGGGTSIGMGIMINENDDYLASLEAVSGVSIDRAQYAASSSWIEKRTSHPASQLQPYTSNLISMYKQFGFENYSPASFNIRQDGLWRPHSIFHEADNGFRRGADILLGSEEYPQPKNLFILTKHTVDRIEFDKSGEVPRATCVHVRASLPQDSEKMGKEATMPLLDMAINALTYRDSTRLWKTDPTKSFIVSNHRTVKICGNEITLAASAILTPRILARSGVGNSHQLSLIGIRKPTLVNEAIGKNFVDRGLIPVALFRNDVAPLHNELEPQVCGIVGLKEVEIAQGPTSRAPPRDPLQYFRTSSSNHPFSLISVEEITGGRIIEGFVYATRILFPKEMRNAAILDVLIPVVQFCSEHDSTQYTACQLIDLAQGCLRQLTAIWYFINSPSSKGLITYYPDSRVVVNPKYFSSQSDMADAVRGVKALLKIGFFDGEGSEMFQSNEEGKCSNLLSKVIFQAVSRSVKARKTNQLSSLNETPNPDNSVPPNLYDEIFEALRDSTADTEFTSDSHSVTLNYTEQEVGDLQIFDFLNPSQDETVFNSITRTTKLHMYGPPSNPKQKIATWPPTLPNLDDDAGIENYIRNSLQSIWHYSGTAQLGKVVNGKFNVKGLNGLSIIDASILPKVTRMNSTATLTILAHYAATLRRL